MNILARYHIVSNNSKSKNQVLTYVDGLDVWTANVGPQLLSGTMSVIPDICEVLYNLQSTLVEIVPFTPRNIPKEKEMEHRKKRDLPKVRALMLNGDGQFCPLQHHMHPPSYPHTTHLPCPLPEWLCSSNESMNWHNLRVFINFAKGLPVPQRLFSIILCPERHCCAASLGTRFRGK